MAKNETEDETETPKKRSNLIPAIVVMVGLLGGGYMMKPAASSSASDSASGSPTAAAGKADVNAYSDNLVKSCPRMSDFLENWKTETKGKAFLKTDQLGQADLGESTFTLADYSYAKLSVSVALTKKAKSTAFAKEEGAEARDVVRKVLSTKSASDLSGANFEEVLCEISGEAAKDYGNKVYQVFVTSMVIQPSGRAAPATTVPVEDKTTTTQPSQASSDTSQADTHATGVTHE